MLRFLPFILWFALALYAVIDCVRTPAHQMPGRLAKPVWLLLIVLVPVGLGAVGWIVVAGAQRAEDRQQAASRPGTTPRPMPRRRPSRPVAPDDDPDFLAQLEQQARARRREERRREREAGGPQAAGRDEDERSGNDAERDAGSEA